MLRWIAGAGCVAMVVVVVILATPGPGYYCGATFGYSARCLSEGDKVDLSWSVSGLGLDAGSASAERIEERRRDLLSPRISLGMGESLGFGLSEHLLYCRSESCTLVLKHDASQRHVVASGRLIYWSSLSDEAFEDAVGVAEQREIDSAAARAGGYDCSEKWGARFVCFDQGDVIDDVAEHGDGGDAITPSGSTVQFNQTGERLEFTFGGRAAIYSIRFWMNCIAERCVLGVSESADDAGEVLEGSFATRRDTQR